MIGKILDETLKRSSKLKDWESIPLIDYTYWDIRYNLPNKINDPYELIRYICLNYAKIEVESLTQSEILSFFFWVKDELVKIHDTERKHLTSRSTTKSKYVPSERAKDFNGLMELHSLTPCPVMKEKYKKMKYSVIFETLLARVIEGEGSYKK